MNTAIVLYISASTIPASLSSFAAGHVAFAVATALLGALVLLAHEVREELRHRRDTKTLMQILDKRGRTTEEFVAFTEVLKSRDKSPPVLSVPRRPPS